jgi:hypothetical protein
MDGDARKCILARVSIRRRFKQRWLDASLFKPSEQPWVNQARFQRNVWVLGAKIVHRKY